RLLLDGSKRPGCYDCGKRLPSGQKEVADQPISTAVECEILPFHWYDPWIAAKKTVFAVRRFFRPPIPACHVAHSQSLPRKQRNGVDVAKSRGCGRLRPAHLAPRLRRRL